MNDTIEPTSDHDAETPMAEYMQVRDPSGTPPNRSNSPAAGSSEGITAGLGALQVLSSPDTAHDETWNSFLDRHFVEDNASKVPSTPSEPSNFSRVSRQINTILEAADGFVSNGVGLAPQDVQSIPSTSVQLPQPMANPTPSSRTQTISFIFTSSRQRTNLRDQNVIGVVAAGGRASTNNVLPNTLPAPSSSPSKTAHSPAVLTPEQTRVHALGAKHAIPAHSPFVQLAKSRSVSTVVGLPLQSPFSLSEEDLLDRNRKGIDFYMDAARLAKTRPSKESLSQPVTPISHLPSPSSSTLSLNDPVSSNTLMMFPRGTPNTRHAPLEALPIVVEPPAGLTHSASPGTSNTSSKKKRCSRSRTRKEPARQEGKPARPSFLNVRYTKYLENDPDRPSFISCLSTKRDTSTSSHGSLSSGKSIASLDESIMGTSGFGVLGSGNAESIFGTAVVKQLPKRLGSDAQRTPSSTASARRSTKSTTTASAQETLDLG